MYKKVGGLMAGLLLPSLAYAHPGHGAGFVAAFVHPFSGIDHWLMMLFVGIWAGRIGGSARWQLPASFLAAMTVGFLLAAGGITIRGIDTGIAAGLIALGVLLAINTKPLVIDKTFWRSARMAMVAAFALLHGMAHGIELNGAQSLSTMGGFIAATALLHAAGVAVAKILRNQPVNFYRALGATLSMIGCGLLLGL